MSFDAAWTSEIGSRVDYVVSGKVQMIPGEQVFAELLLGKLHATRDA